MKMKNIIQISILAGVMCLCYACSSSEGELHEVTQEMQASRGTDIEATAALETAGTLETILKEAHGDDVANITKLTITGSYNGADHNFVLGTLKDLHTLNMKGATIVADRENGYSYNWDKYYLKDNTVTCRMFHALKALKTLVLPDNVNVIADYGLAGLPIESVEFSGINQIGSYAFSECEELVEVKVEGIALSEGMFIIPASVISVGQNFIMGCKRLTSVSWNAAVDVPYVYDVKVSSNILLYVNSENIKVNASWKNLIVNGVAQNITITPQERFHCPQEFTAKNISYTRNFGLRTSIGGNEGWETIVLPFVPTAYAHESKGVIAPFDSEIDTKKHFWLRGLTTEGFADVVTMEANKPYIVSMPNSDAYADEYNLNGNVTFSATDVTVAATPETLESAAGPGFALQPVYAPKETSVAIYVLNVRSWLDSYERGSVFAHSLDDIVQPFEAYAFLTEAKSVRTRVIGVSGNTIGKSRSVVKNTSGVPHKEDMN